MARVSCFLSFCCLLGWLVTCNASAFLSPSSASELSSEDVKQLLLAELAGVGNAGEVAQAEKFMNATYSALPKNEHGKLDATSVNYALHRYFVHKHGWFIRGLGAARQVNQTTNTIFKNRASAYIQSIMEERLHGEGMALHELAVFAVTLSGLIHTESVSQLEMVYSALELPRVGSVSGLAATEAVNYFFEAYLIGRLNFPATTRAGLAQYTYILKQVYPEYAWTLRWVKDTVQTVQWSEAGRRNPFAPELQFTFDNSLKLAHTLTHTFGSFQNLECATLKRKLMHLEYQGTGRVLLSTFYEKGGEDFTESVDYLRNQGALDESDPLRPSVVIPNYVNSMANCLMASDFYMICCSNECEGLMLELESELAAPQVTPAQVAAVVARTASDSVSAPRNLSNALVSRLNQIADINGGYVPLHGRLFAQWMHHAYPRECQYPHVADHSRTTLSAEEWMEAKGIDALDANELEKTRIMSMANATSQDVIALPWDLKEELLAHDKRPIRQGSSNLLKYLAAATAFSSMLYPMLKSLRTTAAPCTQANKNDRLMV